MGIGDSGEMMIMKNCNFIGTNKNYISVTAVLTLVCGVLFFNQHQLAFSQESGFLASHATGLEITSQSSTYKIIPNGRVLNSAVIDPSDTNIIWSNQVGAFNFIIESIPGRSFLQAEASNIDDYILAYNPTSDKAVVLTGNIAVSLDNGIDAQTIANEYNLTLVHDFPSIKRAFFKPSNQSQLPSKITVLNSDYRVLSAYLDVIENFRRTH